MLKIIIFSKFFGVYIFNIFFEKVIFLGIDKFFQKPKVLNR